MALAILLNPNTRSALTTQLVDQVRAHWSAMSALSARSGAMATPPAAPARPPALLALTASHGADYIASEATYVLAAQAALEAWHQWPQPPLGPRPQAILVACFGDPGVWALREASGLPVMGLAEAAMREARALGPFGVVTGGAAWGPMLMRLARGLQCAGPDGLVAVQTVEASGGDMAAAPEAAWDTLAQATIDLLRAHPELRSVILGGAALGGWVPPVQARLLQAQARGELPADQPLPLLIDSVEAGARWLRQACEA